MNHGPEESKNLNGRDKADNNQAGTEAVEEGIFKMNLKNFTSQEADV